MVGAGTMPAPVVGAAGVRGTLRLLTAGQQSGCCKGERAKERRRLTSGFLLLLETSQKRSRLCGAAPLAPLSGRSRSCPAPHSPGPGGRWQGRHHPLAATPAAWGAGTPREGQEPRAASGRVRASLVLTLVILQGVFSYNEIIHVDTSEKVGWSAARVKAQERGEEEIIQ